MDKGRPLAAHPTTPPSAAAGLRFIAVFDATKGLLVLLAGLGLLSLRHRDLQVLAETLVEHRRLAHHLRISGVLLRAAQNVTNGELMGLASFALAYSTIKLTAAYGLWRQREWAQWWALLSGSVYLPWEILAIVHHATATRFLVFVFNTTVLAYLAWVRYLKASRRSRSPVVPMTATSNHRPV